jgi:hypothetical protein
MVREIYRFGQVFPHFPEICAGFNSRRLHHFFASLRKNCCNLRFFAFMGGGFYSLVPLGITLKLR